MIIRRIEQTAPGQWVRNAYLRGRLLSSTPVTEVSCEECAGTGRVQVDVSPWRTVDATCDECHGRGTVWEEEEEAELMKEAAE